MGIYIESERLMLRSWKEDDNKPFAELNGNSNVMKYFPAPLSVEESNAFVDRINAELEETGFGLYAVEIKETGEFIGYVDSTDLLSMRPSHPVGKLAGAYRINFGIRDMLLKPQRHV